MLSALLPGQTSSPKNLYTSWVEHAANPQLFQSCANAKPYDLVDNMPACWSHLLILSWFGFA